MCACVTVVSQSSLLCSLFSSGEHQIILKRGSNSQALVAVKQKLHSLISVSHGCVHVKACNTEAIVYVCY